MPYVPRQATTAQCAHCNASFEKKHASRKYCSNSCNVQANYARNGRPGDGRATRADLEQMLAQMKQLLQDRSPAPSKPAAKAVAKARFAEAAQKQATIEATQKITKPARPKPTAKAAATKPKKKAVAKSTKPTQPTNNDALIAQRRAELKEKVRVALVLLTKEERAGQVDAKSAAEKRRRLTELASK